MHIFAHQVKSHAHYFTEYFSFLKQTIQRHWMNQLLDRMNILKSNTANIPFVLEK